VTCRCLLVILWVTSSFLLSLLDSGGRGYLQLHSDAQVSISIFGCSFRVKTYLTKLCGGFIYSASYELSSWWVEYQLLTDTSWSLIDREVCCLRNIYNVFQLISIWLILQRCSHIFRIQLQHIKCSWNCGESYWMRDLKYPLTRSVSRCVQDRLVQCQPIQ